MMDDNTKCTKCGMSVNSQDHMISCQPKNDGMTDIPSHRVGYGED